MGHHAFGQRSYFNATEAVQKSKVTHYEVSMTTWKKDPQMHVHIYQVILRLEIAALHINKAKCTFQSTQFISKGIKFHNKLLQTHCYTSIG